MRNLKLLFVVLIFLLTTCLYAEQDLLLNTMQSELTRSFKLLKKAESDAPLYFLQYTVTDEHAAVISASYGATQRDRDSRRRYLTVDARVGSYKLDNTHEIRGGGYDFSYYMPSDIELPLNDDVDAIKSLIWEETDRSFKRVLERFMKVKADKGVKVTEKDTSPDFSAVPPQKFIAPKETITYDHKLWTDRVKKLSARFKDYPWIHNCSVSFGAEAVNNYLVTSEGTKLRHGSVLYRISVHAGTIADDGMELYLYNPFFAKTVAGLPSDEQVISAIDSIARNLKALRESPLTTPYTGPAILVNKASGVLFHEIFGHRIEGHRQKSESEGQTFTDKVGKKILPDFLSVYDNPTSANFENQTLLGHYQYDDEGVKAEKVTVVKNGTLQNFLMSRSPIKGFSKSNGHGRREHGSPRIISRQGNLIVESANQVSYSKLRDMLIQECKAQNKPYGLIFYDVSGGFTMTGRRSVQAFKVVPLLVHRVYIDGHEEVVRGVDIVGTPLASFEKIIATGDDPDIFNGTCGAESGGVPVSAISPSILIKEIEVEKKAKSQDKPPLLPAPLYEKK